MKKVLGFGLTLVLAASLATFSVSSAEAISSCNDGTFSNSSGRGTCSWHGGVKKFPSFKTPSYKFKSYKAPKFKSNW